MDSCCLIRGVLLIVGGSRGAVSGCCTLMTRPKVYGEKLLGCSRGL